MLNRLLFDRLAAGSATRTAVDAMNANSQCGDPGLTHTAAPSSPHDDATRDGHRRSLSRGLSDSRNPALAFRVLVGSVLMAGLAGCAPQSLTLAAEAPLLRNVRQLTRPEMGFEKAGEAYFSPDGQKVIFQAVPTGKKHYQIYVMNVDGSGLDMVSTGKGECSCGYFHPDGQSIVFASSHLDPRLADGDDVPEPEQGYQSGKRRYVWHFNEHMDIFAANLDGSNARRLTDAHGYDAEGAYDRDGRTIAFASKRTGDMEIYTMHADGTNVRRLTNAKGYDGGPFISPDGTRIIFRADRKGDDRLQLFVMDIDGSNERQLTTNEAVNWGPFWHPSGRFAAFATSLQGHHNYEIYLIHVASGALQRVTHGPGADVLPVFSADGKRMMWTAKRGPDKTSQVFLADFHPEHAFAGKP